MLRAGILGGYGQGSGLVEVSGTIKKLQVVRGITGLGIDSGGPLAGSIGKGEIGMPTGTTDAYRPITAGFGPGRGFVNVSGNVGALRRADRRREGSGILNVAGTIGSLTVRGSLLGGSGENSPRSHESGEPITEVLRMAKSFEEVLESKN